MSKNKVVIFNGATQHSFSAQKDCLVTLNAGSNVVSVEKLNRIMGTTGDEELDAMKSDSFLEMLDDETIVILDEDSVVTAETSEEENTSGVKNPNDDNIEIDIVKTGAKDAISLINAEVDVEKVKSWLAAEKASGNDARSSVVKACNKQIEALEKPDTTEE